MKTVIAKFRQVASVFMRLWWIKYIPNAVDRDQVVNKFTWGYYAQNIFTAIQQFHLNANEFHVVNDRYDIDLSIENLYGAEGGRKKKQWYLPKWRSQRYIGFHALIGMMVSVYYSVNHRRHC